MKLPRRVKVPKAIALGCVVLLGACNPSSDGTGSGGTHGGGGSIGSGGSGTTGGTTGGGGAVGSGGKTTPGSGGTVGSGGQSGTGGSASPTASGGQTGAAGRGTGGAGATGQTGAGGAGGRTTGSGGQGGGGTGAGGALVNNCKGSAWPTADPMSMGTLAITTEKNIGPMAGALPDPVYGDMRQQFNIYRPRTLGEGGRCHPILVWSNGHTDNPEPNPPLCQSSKYCGSYKMLVEQMASQGFVVISSLSTITSQADPTQGNRIPSLVGLDWLLQQAEDPASPYYHHLDTSHIGAFGHSEGGAATSMLASDPRISAIATVSGTRANPNIHQPTLVFCGGKESASTCTNIMTFAASITTVPSMFVNNLDADHGGWLYQNGVKGPDIFAMTAWFRYWLMDDTAQRKFFYGSDCTLCTDSRLKVTRNMLLTQ